MIDKKKKEINLEETLEGVLDVSQLILECVPNWRFWADQAIKEEIDVILEVLCNNVEGKDECYYKPESLITYNPEKIHDPLSIFIRGFSVIYVGGIDD
jgi:hypothetical protein